MAKPKLTVKQAKFVKAKVEGKSGTQAYMEAYGTKNKATAAVEASKTLNKPNIQEAFQQAMAAQGITIEKIVKPIADGLEAEKVHIVGNGDQAMAEVVPDHSIRLKASGMAQNILGLKSEGGATTNFIQIVQTQRDQYDL